MAQNGISSGKAQLDALVALISKSVADITSTYESAQVPLPSLDPAALESTEDGKTLDDTTERDVARAVRVIEAACAQLVASLARPGRYVLNRASAYEESSCLQVALAARVADHLRDAKTGAAGLHVDKLGAATGIPAPKLARVLRMLATDHIFCEVEPDTFANNRLSLELLAEKPCSAVSDIVTNEQLKGAAYLSEALLDPKTPVPFEKLYGTSIMGYFTNPDLQKRREIWGRGIAAWLDVGGHEGLHKLFSWSERLVRSGTGEPVKVCDVGAGNGHVTLDLLRAFPDADERAPLRAFVQDVPATLELAKQWWRQNYPEAMDAQRVQFHPINFFEEAPVEGCDYYYMRFCLHNWSDELFIKIVKNVAQAMASKKETSRFLIHDIVLDHPIFKGASDAEEKAPAPLLPNFGAARLQEYAGDLNMMVLMDAKERSLGEMLALAKEAGLTLEAVHRSVETAVIELKLA